MAATVGDNQPWSADFDTLRREKLFRDPPRDKTVNPALAEAFVPHISSFNAVFEKGGLLNEGIKDIGTKTILDGNPDSLEPLEDRNRLNVRLREFFLDKAVLPPSNKFSTQNREIYPAECRERHATYRGVFKVRLDFKVNDGDWREVVRDLGRLPLMLRVSMRPRRLELRVAELTYDSRINAIWRLSRPRSS